MKIYSITDEYGYDEDYSYLDSLLENCIKKFDITSEFSITFIGDEEVQRINREYRKVDRVTDVISFALNDHVDMYHKEEALLGDIFISIPQMKRQSEMYGHSEKRELSFLVVHGLLHLLGYDHQTAEEEKVMFTLQKEVLLDEGITE